MKRGLFIDFEGFQETNYDQKILKELNNQLKTEFKLVKFKECPKDKEDEMKFMEKESKKMFYRASLMLSARDRELKRKEMLEELNNGNNIITINYCFYKIAIFLKQQSDKNFAKQLFRGAIRPDIVICQNDDNNYNELLSEYPNILFKVDDDKENIISNFIDDIVNIYQDTKENYKTYKDNYKKNYYPNSIGEDLFINWPS